MPDGKSWRLGHNKPYKKQSKAPTPLKADSDGSAALEDVTDKRRQTSWRKTLQSSRPQTPASALATAATPEDTEDGPSERLEMPAPAPVPARESKPKLSRYTSFFSSFKETAKVPDFLEPWGEEAPPPFQPYADSLHVMQSIRSHIIRSSAPISPEHNSGLLRLFEDYRKIRERKELLEKVLEETLRDWAQAQAQWSSSEDGYHAEIRRLELLIARGASGMTGLVQARQGSIIDRQRMHRNTLSRENSAHEYELLPAEKLDAEIKLLSQRVLLRRPVSPSENMMALSKRFADSAELLVGAPPDSRKLTLSRKVQSEMNLATMHNTKTPPSVTDSAASAFSGSSGDALPDETMAPSQTGMQPATECNAFIALRKLGTLVARRRGLEPESFNRGLMMLFSQSRPAERRVLCEDQKSKDASIRQDSDTKKSSVEQAVTRTRGVRRFQSQPQLGTQQKHRRQFSFEPGADELVALAAERMPCDWDVCNGNPAELVTQLSIRESQPTTSRRSTPSLHANSYKSSKIPSPIQNLGRSRKENSSSSVHSSGGELQDGRRGSRCSVLAAFYEKDSGEMGPGLQSLTRSVPSLGTSACRSMSTDYSSSTGLGRKTQAKVAGTDEGCRSRGLTTPRANEAPGLAGDAKAPVTAMSSS